MYLITDYIQDPDVETRVLGSPLEFRDRHKVQALLVWHEKINDEYIAQFNSLKGVVRYGVGYDNIDLEVLERREIIFCNTPDYGVDEVSDTAVGMILNISRGISLYDRKSRLLTGQRWQEERISSLTRNSDQIIGVIGAGRIGGSVCRKLKAIGFQVVFHDPYVCSGHEKMLGVGRVGSLAELLSISDQVTIHTPLTGETRAMVDDKFVSLMKNGSSLVNTARGEIIASLDVIEQGLKSGQLGNVALDVLPEEPPQFAHSLIRSWQDDESWLSGRLIINPHSAFFSQRAFREMRENAALNVKRILDGQEPLNIIKR
jgi:lactate dehydrogenase-like 2-hydroxyacid dehydrogenase